MYQDFGAIVTGSAVEFKLFIPDNTVDPTQYTRGGDPHIRAVRVVGTFQSRLGQTDWTPATGLMLTRKPHPNGRLYTARIDQLPEGFYEYKYYVEFEAAEPRWCGDPCTKYDGIKPGNSGFVIGGNTVLVNPVNQRLPLRDLVIYEMMIDDFTAQFRGNRAPLDAVRDKIDYLADLGVNAVEFMPWTAWREDGYSWGYNPVAFFAVEYRYYNDPAAPADKLYYLQRLVNELHERGLHVIMDGVFHHVDVGDTPEGGFPYYWLYQTPSDSPFVGHFDEDAFYPSFDFGNECTAQFIFDVCAYWLDTYKLDGIRFDYAKGYLQGADPHRGIRELIGKLNQWLGDQGHRNVSFTLELLTDNRYDAVGLTDQIGATGCWYDQLMWDLFGAGRSGQIGTNLIRALDAGQDFADGRLPVTYAENHDHATLTEQCGGRDRWWRTQPPAIALLTICGAPLIHNGQEFGEQYWFPESGDGRVQARPLRWERVADDTGQRLLALYRTLIRLRATSPALRSPNFYPRPYDEQATRFDGQGYGADTANSVVIYHRWAVADNGQTTRFMIVLNFSDSDQRVDIPFDVNGEWQELLGKTTVTVQNFWLRNETVSSHWARIYRNTT